MACLAAAIVMLVTDSGQSTSVLVAVGAVVAGAGLLYYEHYRLQSPTVLVPQGGKIAVYRKSALSVVIERSKLVRYQLHPANTFRYLMAPVGAIGVSVAGLLGAFRGSRDTDGVPNAVFLLGVAWGVALLVSLIRTRILGLRYQIISGNWREEVMLARADDQRLRS